MNHDVNKGEKKIMNNNPTVKGVNFVNDLVGDSGNTRGYKIFSTIIACVLFVIGMLFFVAGKIFTGLFLYVIAIILILTTYKMKFKSSKYKVDKKIEEIEPLFKDNKE